MSDSSSWQNFSVQEFFGQSNWEGDHHTKDLDGMFQEISWLCLKIEDFFSHSNWQGELAAKIGLPAFSITLPVNEFFQCFVWEINPQIAALPELESTPESNSSADDNLTLDDLSNLF